MFSMIFFYSFIRHEAAHFTLHIAHISDCCFFFKESPCGVWILESKLGSSLPPASCCSYFHSIYINPISDLRQEKATANCELAAGGQV